MSNVQMSLQDYSKSDLVRLVELLRKNQELEILLSCSRTKRELPEETLGSILIRLGVKANLKGYQYLKTAVMLSVKDREELDGVTKRLYPDIAREHKTGVDKVEHAIRHAISSSWERGKREEQERIFGYCAGEGKRPTNSEFIVGLVDHMSLRGKEWYS